MMETDLQNTHAINAVGKCNFGLLSCWFHSMTNTAEFLREFIMCFICALPPATHMRGASAEREAGGQGSEQGRRSPSLMGLRGGQGRAQPWVTQPVKGRGQRPRECGGRNPLWGPVQSWEALGGAGRTELSLRYQGWSFWSGHWWRKVFLSFKMLIIRASLVSSSCYSLAMRRHPAFQRRAKVDCRVVWVQGTSSLSTSLVPHNARYLTPCVGCI